MVGKHAAAFRHRCLGATRCAEEIEQVVRSTSRSVYLNGCLAAKSGICAGCGSSTPLFFNPPQPDSRPAWVGRHLYATIMLDFPPSKPNATLSSLLLHSAPPSLELLHTPPCTSRSPCLSKSITAAAAPVSVGSPTV